MESKKSVEQEAKSMNKIKKIKPIAKKRRFLRWIKRLLGIQSPSGPRSWAELGIELDEMHTYRPKVMVPIQITAGVVDDHLDGLPLTEAERRARIERALAERLTREIIEKELYTIQMHEDAINLKTHYRASVRIYHEKEKNQT